MKSNNVPFKNEIVNFIALIETSKQKLDKASSKEVSGTITEIDNKWNELIKN